VSIRMAQEDQNTLAFLEPQLVCQDADAVTVLAAREPELDGRALRSEDACLRVDPDARVDPRLSMRSGWKAGDPGNSSRKVSTNLRHDLLAICEDRLALDRA